MTDDPDGGDGAWVEVHRFAQRAEAEQHALVLAAVGVPCRLAARDGGVALAVAAPDAERARRELATYARENRRRGPAPPAPQALGRGVDPALAYAALLLFLHGAARRRTFGLDWWSAGVARAGLIADGEWWRTVTALGLHADLGHLAGNIGAGGLLGLLLAQLLGPGLAWLAILAAGVAGNAIDALLHPAGHAAVGASTAAFGALGLLAAQASRRRAAFWRGYRRWLPLGAAAMLLAFVGVGGERTAVGAHIAGLAAGGALGLALAWLGERVPRGPGAQRAYGAAALALVALAWVLALRAHG